MTNRTSTFWIVCLGFAATAIIPTVAAADAPTHYLTAYDSGLQGHWLRECWESSANSLFTDFSATAPGRTGTAIEVRFGPDNGWNGFGLANHSWDWTIFYCQYSNEIRTIEFDVYFEPDSTGDGAYLPQPATCPAGLRRSGRRERQLVVCHGAAHDHFDNRDPLKSD